MCTRRMPVDICVKIAIPATRDHLPRGDTLAPNRQCPLVAGTTVYRICGMQRRGTAFTKIGTRQVATTPRQTAAPKAGPVSREIFVM